ncbi:uncharacterized protein B0H64DRAFT_435207 [Chaetomium fimeti]|uniref:Uncharacterized protein n=1 Tax=Chaetomium fimeti TaxID=1854472 RepID=A0AAE0H9V7_9PEZI|nr:hypothetical protein B0H64DRAFT_435207 [Chaetomium fimeti]
MILKSTDKTSGLQARAQHQALSTNFRTINKHAVYAPSSSSSSSSTNLGGRPPLPLSSPITYPAIITTTIATTITTGLFESAQQWQRLDELCAPTQTAPSATPGCGTATFVPCSACPASRPWQRWQRWEVGREGFERAVGGEGDLYVGIAREYGHAQAEEVWETLRVWDYLPANHRKTRVHDKPSPQEVLSVLERVKIEHGDVEAGVLRLWVLEMAEWI